MVVTGHREAPASMRLITALEILGGAKPRRSTAQDEADSTDRAGGIPRLPDPEPTDLYRCFGADGALLYVGISNDVFRRMEEHRMAAPWWTCVSAVFVEHMPSRTSAEVSECSAIRSEHPLHNIAGA